MKNNWLYISLAAALVIALVFFWDTQPQILNPFGNRDAVERRFPYAVIENAHTKHFDETGRLSYEFVANTLRHFRIDLSRISEEDYTTLESPKLTLYTENALWFASADHGQLTENGNLLALWPNVRIWQEEDNNVTIQLVTTHLEISPNTKHIFTDAEVVITSPQSRLTSTGMSVDLSNKRIQLLNRVRGQHEPISAEISP
jgi:lipopolysaccharide export system protein LptC